VSRFATPPSSACSERPGGTKPEEFSNGTFGEFTPGTHTFTQTPVGVLLQLSLSGVPGASTPSTSMQRASANRPSSSLRVGISIQATRITG